MQRLTEEQWRAVLALSEAAANLPPQARRSFLEISAAAPDILEQALSLIDDFGQEAQALDRVGSMIGRFLISEYCGSGGVGDVYRATDTELDRIVALKFLRPAALEQSGAIDRFVREARIVSALNHANIVTVYEVLRSGEELAIVMEFVEGVPIRSLCQAPIPVKQVIAIGRQIASALSAAHQRGVVHRDVKPENVILRPDGSVKVLDFGLAITLSGHQEIDAALSASHIFAGTWRYMSPEQSKGEAITTATDVYSLGLVLYELLTGDPLIGDPPDSGSSNVGDSTDFFRSLSLRKLPRYLQPLLRSMLSQAPSQRPSSNSVGDCLTRIEQSLLRRSRLPLSLAAAAAFFALAFLGRSLFQDNVPGTLLATAISVEPGYKSAPDLAPDGSRIAYSWNREGKPSQIYVQTIDEHTGIASDPVRLTHGSVAEDLPAWAPDKRTIAYTRKAKDSWEIVLRDIATGWERILAPFEGRSLNWTKDGQWLLCSSGQYLNHSVVLISVKTGVRHQLTRTDGELNDDRPISSPNGRTAIFSRFFSDSVSRLATVPITPYNSALSQPFFLSWRGFHARLVRNPVYSSDGRDLFFIAEVDGIRRMYRSHAGRTPLLVASLGERIDELAISSRRNRLAFMHNLNDTNIWKLQLKAAGSSAVAALTRVIASSRMDQRPAISPDGSQIAFESDRSGYPEIWTFSLATGNVFQLTSLRSLCGSPRWSPDSHWVVFDGRVDNSSSIFKIAAKGGQPQRLTNSSAFADGLPVVSPDGQWIYFTSNRSGNFQIWRVPFEGGRPALQTEHDSTVPELSHDGRFLYYLERFWQPSRLWRKDLLTGQTSAVADDVFFRAYIVGKNGLYISRLVGQELTFFSTTLEGRWPHALAVLPSNTVGGISIDQGEDALYLGKLDSSGDEIMLVNNF